MSDDILAEITKTTLEGELEATIALIRQARDAGVDPMDVINQGLVPGMDIAGEKFADGEYFLPHLMMSARAMQEAMDILEPELIAREGELEKVGTIVLGTVHGDIHEIGKSLVATMLTANGFQVHDLGVDVPVERFVEKVEETGAELLGLSALLTTTMVVQREVIDALIDAGLREKVKVLVGGAPVNRDWMEEIGADGYADDAMSAVRVARFALGKQPSP